MARNAGHQPDQACGPVGDMGADRAALCDDALLLGGQLRLFDESARDRRAVAAARVGALYALARPPHDRAARRLLAVRALADCARPTRPWQGDGTTPHAPGGNGLFY